MASANMESTVAITRTKGVLVVTMQPDLDGENFDAMRKAVLDRIVKESIKAVVLDFSAVDVMNLSEFKRIRSFLISVCLLGAESAIASLSPAVVLYLTEVQAETGGISYFFGLDEALTRFGEK